MRKILRLPNDIRSGVIKNTSSWSSRSVVDVVNDLAAQILIKCQPDPIREVLTELIPAKTFFQREKKIIIEKSVHEMMLAVSFNRTIVHYGVRHYCNEHQAMVDKNHINECSLIQECGKVTQFNELMSGGRSVAQLNKDC